MSFQICMASFLVKHKKGYFEDVAKQHWTPLTFTLSFHCYHLSK